MAIDILKVEPTTISRDLKEKFILIYSTPKAGKTTFASRIPKNLLLASERGYNAISGLKAVDITKWSEFKTVVSQLRKEESKEMYDTITLDTVTIFYELCEAYICARHNVDSISEISWGRGYIETKEEFANVLRQITMLGYGLIMIAHSERRIEKSEERGEVEYISPAMNKRAYEIVNQLADIIGYIEVEFNSDGSSQRWLYTRRTPTIMAGSRFPHLAPKIPFGSTGYEELTAALSEAIEKSEQEGAVLVDTHFSEESLELAKGRPFEELKEEARQEWERILTLGDEKISDLQNIIKDIFGRTVKLSEITPKQQDLFELVLKEMKKL